MSKGTKDLFNKFSQLMTRPEFVIALQSIRFRRSGESHHGRGQGRLLHLIATHEELTNTEISEILDIRPSSVTALVNKLVDRGIVQKVPLENDRRVTILKLTDKGQTVVDNVQNADDIFTEQLFKNMSEEEQDELSELLKKVADNLDSINFDDEQFAIYRRLRRGGHAHHGGSGFNFDKPGNSGMSW